MAQHDYDIANQSGSAFRADLNNALQAIVSSNSGASAPSTTYAHQEWIDTSTTPATIKRRDAANAGWLTIGTVDATAQTFAAAGSERMRITSTGLGVGTSAGEGTLQVAGTARIGLTGSSTPATSQLHIYQSNGNNGISWADSSFGLAGYIQTSAGGLQFGGRVNSTTQASPASPQMTLVDGRVGIGTTSPQGILEAKKTGSSTTPNLVLQSGGPGDPSTVDPQIQFAASGAESPGTTKIYSTGALGSRSLVFATGADAAGTERMRIINSGYLKVSNTGAYTDSGGGSRSSTASHFFRSDQNLPTIIATNTNTSNAVEGVTSDFAAGATGNHFIGAVNLVRVFIVAANGNVTNTNNSYGAISDAKLKENIVDATSQWDDIKALQVRKYNFKEGQTHTQIGLVAQEVEQVSPGLVGESPDLDADGNDLGTVTKNVNYSVLYIKAVKALQEAMERIETLEAKVAALEAA